MKIDRLREYVAFAGETFTIEWYFDCDGSSQALDYYCSLSPDRRERVLMLFRRMGEDGKIFDQRKFRSEGDKIFAFKPQPDRFLCFFFVGRKIIVSNAFEKREQKLSGQEKQRALRARADYEERVKRGKYYG